MNSPRNVVDCWILNEDEVALALKDNRPFCEYINPYNYFLKTKKVDKTTLEGYIGHRDAKEDFHETILTNYTYFQNHKDRKKVYVTFDKSVLYHVADIFPSRPLLFTLQQITNLTGINDMINQEQIYQLVFNERWAEIIKILYKHKADIVNEPALSHAAQIFENEFMKKVDDYPISNKEIEDVLKSAYLIHYGKFYRFNDLHLRKITIEIARRVPLKEAYDYAKQYPDDEIAREILEQYSRTYYLPAEGKQTQVLSKVTWVEIFNRLFELIDDQKDGINYFSGPRFIKVAKEVMPYYPDYSQFIELRNDSGKSTSRKIFFYDVLMEADEHSREAIVDKILGSVKGYYPDKVRAIQMLMGKKVLEDAVIQSTKAKEESSGNPVVFISYSWDDEEHKAWVLELANRLRKNGVNVILDRYKLTLGKSLPHFIEQSINAAHRILVIFTPNYRLKADGRSGGVGYEYSIMNAELYRDQINNDKVIPVLRRGSIVESIPSFMQQYIHLDLRDDNNFETSYVELIRDIYNDPAIKAPELGSKPEFE
jgi:hypothetical protein